MIITDLLPSWKLALHAASKSPKAIASYPDTVKRLEAYLATEGLELGAPGIRGFLAACEGAHVASVGSEALPEPVRLLPLADRREGAGRQPDDAHGQAQGRGGAHDVDTDQHRRTLKIAWAALLTATLHRREP